VRRRLLATICGLYTFGIGVALPAVAQVAYPVRPIHIIVPYPPGGTIDPLARLIGEKMTQAWGQPVVIDNRPGGNTIIGSEALLRAPADGYTILLTSTSHVIIPSLLPVTFDALRDFVPVGMLASNAIVLAVNPAVPAANLKALIALAKANPRTLNYASSGTGSINHLAGEIFDIEAGVKTQHVPYKGGGAAMNDLVGGQVQLSFASAGAVPFVKSGKLRALAVTGSSRMPALPDVPTFAEAGLPGVDVINWVGAFMAAQTPKLIVDKVAAMLGRILAMPEIKEKLAGQGIDVAFVGPDAFAAILRTDMAKYAKVIKTADIRMDN
jgi:tripartite-type tricarboxylate transporter receptor subunit TctC